MKKILILSAIVYLLILLTSGLKAQIKLTSNQSFKPSAEDSLFNEFQNTVYYTFYNPVYMANKTPTFTMLKIDIDWQGKVTNISFSDSADSTFVNAFSKKKWHDDKATLEKYAKLKSLTDISLLIPVSYEPNYPNKGKAISYDELDALMKFNKQSFTGKSIMYPAINIVVLSTGNM